ncbi:hypothetical protein B0H14DRAFT_3521208 [Mycena olivaceomarginata]|nr:hypothetical protein B0H14DRAFT_3521208 [Mycena olivaceomarginata]
MLLNATLQELIAIDRDHFNLLEAYISTVESPCIVSTLSRFPRTVLRVVSTPRVLYLSGYHTLFDSFRVPPRIPTYDIRPPREDAAALNAVQQRCPQIYKTNERLVLKPDTIEVGLRDFMISIKKLVPAAVRSSSSMAALLPQQLTPLLGDVLERVKTAIGLVLPVNKKLSVLEEAEYEDTGGESGALKCEMTMQTMASLRVYRSRVVLHGAAGMGQTFVGAAALHHLEGYHVQSLELGALLSDSTRTSEAAIVRLFVEVKRHAPAVVYIPALRGWCTAVSETARATVRAMLDTLAPADPVLLLAVVDGHFADLPHDVPLGGPSSREQHLNARRVQVEHDLPSMQQTSDTHPESDLDARASRSRTSEAVGVWQIMRCGGLLLALTPMTLTEAPEPPPYIPDSTSKPLATRKLPIYLCTSSPMRFSSVLDQYLASRWKFTDIRDLAIRELGAFEMDPVEKIKLQQPLEIETTVNVHHPPRLGEACGGRGARQKVLALQEGVKRAQTATREVEEQMREVEGAAAKEVNEQIWGEWGGEGGDASPISITAVFALRAHAPNITLHISRQVLPLPPILYAMDTGRTRSPPSPPSSRATSPASQPHCLPRHPKPGPRLPLTSPHALPAPAQTLPSPQPHP